MRTWRACVGALLVIALLAIAIVACNPRPAVVVDDEDASMACAGRGCSVAPPCGQACTDPCGCCLDPSCVTARDAAADADDADADADDAADAADADDAADAADAADAPG